MGENDFSDELKAYDKSNYKMFIDGFIEDIKKGYNQSVENEVSHIKKNINMRVICCGMGGSGIVADIMKTYLDDVDFVLEKVNSSKISGKLTESDFVIVSSYSGNTEEEISCFKQARRAGCQIVVITSGGKLEIAANESRIPIIKLPKNYQPRAILGYVFSTLLRILEEIGLITSRRDEVQEAVSQLVRQKFDDFAKNLSEKIYGKIPLIYASDRFYSVAYRWKTQINENAKNVAFCNKFSELNHNETAGFQFKNGIFHVVIITTDSDNNRMKKRMQVQKDLLQKAEIDVTELNVKGSLLAKIFAAVIAGDLTSYYLALRNRVDPEPVEAIENFKNKLGPFV